MPRLALGGVLERARDGRDTGGTESAEQSGIRGCDMLIPQSMACVILASALA